MPAALGLFDNVMIGSSFVCAVVAAVCFARRRSTQWRLFMIGSYGCLFIVDLVSFIVYLVKGEYFSAVLSLVGMAWTSWLMWWFWRNWKDRKKVAEMLGAKSRALRDKVVRKMREVQVPSPIPVPS